MTPGVHGVKRTADPAVIQVTNGQLDNQTEIDNKGYTGQEMLDQLALVHLNGRVYDPLVGRFISADPEIQDPTHSQSYNRYTYVWNNPTNDTDPTGFEAESEGDGDGGGGSAGMQAESSGGSESGFGAANFSADRGSSTQSPAGAGPAAGEGVKRVEVEGKHDPRNICSGEGCKAVLEKFRQEIEILKHRVARDHCAGQGGLCITKTINAINAAVAAASNSTSTKVEVLTEAPVGWGASSLGHAAIVIDGIVFTFGHDGMNILSEADYLKKNGFRETIGSVINVPTPEAALMLNLLSSYKADYNALQLSTCVQPVYLSLVIGGVLKAENPPVFPASLGTDVLDSGRVDKVNIYDRSTAPAWTDSFTTRPSSN